MSDAAATTSKPSPLHYISEHLQDLRNKGTAPKLRVLEGEQKPVAVFDGKEIINLASNNYLGIDHPQGVAQGLAGSHPQIWRGAGAVRTIAGTMKLHMELEEQIARFKNVEACVVFQSGFTANAGTVSAVWARKI